MTRTIAYLRVSTSKQDVENQELELLRYASANSLSIDDWFKLEVSSRKSLKDRRIDELLDSLSSGDILIVSELSRLGRSLSQIIGIVDQLLDKGVTFIAIKQGMRLNGEQDMTAKIQVAMFGLLAELERDLISERTKMGIARAKSDGKVVGRPKGSRKSALDSKMFEIQSLLSKGISKSSIAKLLGVSGPSLHYFLKTRSVA
jgi:DNA invertase Pin-like site-specific DNA recombinase